MDSTTDGPWGEAQDGLPGVYQSASGYISIHVIIDDGSPGVIPGDVVSSALAPPNTLELDHFTVFEDTVQFVTQDEEALVLHVSAPELRDAVVYFYRPDQTLVRALPLNALNPGWVCGRYRFRGDLKKMVARLARLEGHSRSAPCLKRNKPTLWEVSGWRGPVVCAPLGLVERLLRWRHELSTPPEVAVPDAEAVEVLTQPYPQDVAQVLVVKAQAERKVTYRLGGAHLVLSYLERLGLAEVVNRYCRREGELSEGTVFVVLVINRLLFPLPLRHVGEWAGKVGLDLLLGMPDVGPLNPYRLADTLAAVSAHWEAIATDVTLNAVERFGLQVETIHYDLTSVFFHGAYKQSEMVDFGYSRDHRPGKPQVVIALNTTADGEVPLPGGCGVHNGKTTDVDTAVENMQRLQATFRRTDLLVTGDRAMQSAENMLTIARAHGRYLGPLKLTDTQKALIARIPAAAFKPLPESDQAGRLCRAVFRRFWFTVKEPLSEAARERRRKRRRRGRPPQNREVRFWVRAAVILDEAKRRRDAARRKRLIETYETELDYCIAHLNKGQYYGDPKWVAEHLQALEEQYQAVRACVCYIFEQRDGQMTLSYRRDELAIVQASRLDGKWVLVSNCPPAPGQSQQDYVDWMLCTYKAHAGVERRMRNLKSDLPIRPLYVHRDDHITGLCFASLLALTVHALIERDCKHSAELVAADLASTQKVVWLWWGYSVTGIQVVSGYEVLWPDTLTAAQRLTLQALDMPDPGTRVPEVRWVAEEPTEGARGCFCLSICSRPWPDPGQPGEARTLVDGSHSHASSVLSVTASACGRLQRRPARASFMLCRI
jgi:transposase